MPHSKKELSQLLNNSIKAEKKAERLQSRGQFLFKKEGEYFITIIVLLSGRKNEKIKVVGSIKPYVFDDIFWKVLNMPDNCDAPIGLRANGAFKFNGLVVFSELIDYNSAEELPELASSLLHKCYGQLVDIIKDLNSVDDFLALAKGIEKRGLFDYNLAYMISLIANKKYNEAKAVAEKLQLHGEFGSVQNEGKYIYEHIIEYCNRYM